MRGWWLLILLAGCGKTDTATTPAGTAGGTAAGTVATGNLASGTVASGTTATGTSSTTGTLPADPRPISITFSGAINETIVFDTPSCSNYPSPSFVNFRTFWRGSSHNALMIAEVLTDFTGEGSYDTASHNLRIKLQTEAGSTFSFDAAAIDTTQGDSGTMTIDHIGNIAHGEFSFTGMHSTAGAITATPSTVPIWCETVEN